MNDLDERRIEGFQIEAAELAIVELAVTLEAKGLLTRMDIAKAMKRAELSGHAKDTVSKEEENVASDVAGAVRLIGGLVEDRLGAMPEFFMLAKDIQDWEAAGSRGMHPAEPERLPEPDGCDPSTRVERDASAGRIRRRRTTSEAPSRE